jgi:CMP-N-acetylneuraminic acid synthetase
MKKIKRIAIIPARGGSKRIPKKNIKLFCGKPMILYSLMTLKESGIFDVIHVSTDSQEIADVVEENGFTVDFLRPPELADDHTPIMPVLKWVLEQYNKRGFEFRDVAVVMPCSLFIETKDYICAAQMLEKFEHNKTIISIAPYPVPIEWGFKLNSEGMLSPTQPGMFAKRSQDLPLQYYDTGSFVFYPINRILHASGAGDDTNYAGQIVDKYKAIDIDDMEDWEYAENLMRGLKNI